MDAYLMRPSYYSSLDNLLNQSEHFKWPRHASLLGPVQHSDTWHINYLFLKNIPIDIDICLAQLRKWSGLSSNQKTTADVISPSHISFELSFQSNVFTWPRKTILLLVSNVKLFDSRNGKIYLVYCLVCYMHRSTRTRPLKIDAWMKIRSTVDL